MLISLTEEAYQKVQKEEFMTSEGSKCHQKDHRCIRKRDYPKGYVQKGDHQKDASHEVPHPQSFFYMVQGSISKSQNVN